MIRWTGWLGLVGFLMVSASIGEAHPMGNFSINHYSRIKVGQRTVEILYLVDRAEIPTYQEIRQSGLVAQDGDSSIAPYLRSQAASLKAGLAVECDGRPVTLQVIAQKAEFSAGAGGLPTLKLTILFRGNLDRNTNSHELNYVDGNFPGRPGWKEVIVAPSEGTAIRETSAPSVDRSNELTVYSSDLLNSPPQQLSARVVFASSPVALPTNRIRERPSVSAITIAPRLPAAGVPVLSKMPVAHKAQTKPSPPREGNTPRSRFTELISTQTHFSLWLLLSAALVSAGLGSLHALEPGHGKTLVAAYLVGSRGTAWHAVLLGIIVTLSHTAGVFALGAITLYASRYIVPEQLYPWLAAISGISVVSVGTFMFLRFFTGAGEHSHSQGARHSHGLLSFLHRPKSTESVEKDDINVSLRQLFALGVTGGIVPCPAALVVLLSAFSLHRIGFGLFLITAFSVGLAAVLVAIGLFMVYAKRFVAARLGQRTSVSRYLPLVSSSFMVVIGVGLTWSAIAALPSGTHTFSKETLVPLVSIVLLGLFLGMRHSTDSDHVVAVSTLVSRQGSLRGSAAIGLLWGLGHTITIFVVGSAIIIFGVVIPPRLGLGMEFAVALMLILLGVLNLTGTLRSITERFSPQQVPPTFESSTARSSSRLGIYHTVRPLFVGLVHGLAGSAAVALLVLSTIKSPFWASAYLLVFGFGTMLGMMLMTAAISMPLIYAKARFARLTGHLTVISGVVSVAFGLFLAIQIGFVDGLFTSHVHWTAH